MEQRPRGARAFAARLLGRPACPTQERGLFLPPLAAAVGPDLEARGATAPSEAPQSGQGRGRSAEPLGARRTVSHGHAQAAASGTTHQGTFRGSLAPPSPRPLGSGRARVGRDSRRAFAVPRVEPAGVRGDARGRPGARPELRSRASRVRNATATLFRCVAAAQTLTSHTLYRDNNTRQPPPPETPPLTFAPSCGIGGRGAAPRAAPARPRGSVGARGAGGGVDGGAGSGRRGA